MSFNIPSRMQVSIKLLTDKKGLTARECPKCEKIFKIKNGTGLKGKDLPCHCPYCGHVQGHDQFYTKEQVKYAESVAMRQFTDLVHSELKKLEFNHPPRGAFGIGISLKVKAQSPSPIRYYYETKVETDVACERCTLVYAIYGEFAYCPDCGSHNSVTILNKNIEFVQKMLMLAKEQEPDLAERLINDALENLVSAFDGFGREVCRISAPRAVNPTEAADIRFQNLTGAQKRVQKQWGFDLSSFVSSDEWKFVCQCFEKRHLLAHKMGVVDEDYLKATQDRNSIVGRKIAITSEEVTRLGASLSRLGGQFTKQLLA